MVELEDAGPYAMVWRRLRRLPIDERNEFLVVEASTDGAATITCSGASHRVQVWNGELLLDDHDVDAELALLALGAVLPACLVYLAVWEQAQRDSAFLLAWGDDAEADGLRPAREDWDGNYWESWPSEPPAGRALFGPILQRELALAAAGRVAAESSASLHPSWFALQRATQTRARRSFVTSLAAVDAHPRPDALVPVRISVAGGPDVGSARGRLARHGSTVDLVLPADWMETVWRPGHDIIGDGFVLSLRGDEAQVVRWEATGAADAEHAPTVVTQRLPRAT